MIEAEQIYKCHLCGNEVKVLVAGGGELVCCGQPSNIDRYFLLKYD